ncbi:MAG: outer membrane beta-barrel protein [Planctomycetota bacterium]|nr:outer membrane beta-barrel protein [Planctomycetota bacterium]
MRVPVFVILACALAAGVRHASGGELKADLPATFAPRGITFGHLTVFPALGYDLTYTDNSTRAQRNTTQDVLQEYTPSFDARFRPSEHVTSSLSYEFGWHDYAKETAKHYLSHKAAGEVRIANLWLEGLSVSLSDAYLQTGNTNALENQILAFTRYHTNQTVARTQYDFSRFTVSGKYTYAFTDYFARVDEMSEFSTHSGEVEGAYRFVPDRFTLFGSCNFTRTLDTHTNVGDFDSQTLLTGVRGTYSKLSYSVGVGYGFAQYLHQPMEDSGPCFDASLSYAPHRRLTVAVVASRHFVAAVQTGVSTDTNVRATLSILLTERGKMIFDYTRNESLYQTGIDQVSMAYNTSFEYKLARFAVATVGYARTERRLSTGTGEFTINEGHVGFRLAW